MSTIEELDVLADGAYRAYGARGARGTYRAYGASGPTDGLGPAVWICRYLPAQVVGTAALVLAGVGATFWTSSPVVIALAALAGESIGFTVVLALTIILDQPNASARGHRADDRTARILGTHVGTAVAVDRLLVRPVALLLGVWLLSDPVWGLLAGKLVADVVFAASAGSFSRARRTRLRGSRVAGERGP
ncbi:hypothetical protein [Microbacterium ulmi]|uniref:hypothetical protein n=1 Tax=Microbacterium ulmi TaxID=179095 RepID=UPI001FB909B5|nr:hypothetical protein [Microbacterium ulmi]NII68829.1 hypothetical protein [Microbacterium ulmi]